MLPVWHYFVNRKQLKVSFCHILVCLIVKLAQKTPVFAHGIAFENIPA